MPCRRQLPAMALLGLMAAAARAHGPVLRRAASAAFAGPCFVRSPLAGPARRSPLCRMLAAPAARSPSSRPSQGPRRGGGGRGGGGGGGGSPKKAAELPSIVYRMDDGPKRVVISSGKARLFKEGNPLVYGGAVAEVYGSPSDGELVQVLDQKGNLIGGGMYNQGSMYRVRLLWHAGERGFDASVPIEEIVQRRVAAAVALRAACGLPSEATDCYRLIHGEGDRLSGLVIDVFGDTAVIASSAVWVEMHQDLITSVVERQLSPRVSSVIWRRSDGRLEQDGWMRPPSEAPAAAEEGEEEEGEDEEEVLDDDEGEEAQAPSPSRPLREVWVRELGLKYKVLPELGQKTGFYCDQRDLREMVRGLSAGKTVADICCYSGSCALNAAKGGAKQVIGVDSSARALQTAEDNAKANDLPVTFERADALKFMQQEAAAGNRYGLVILDPPKLAPTRKALPRALLKYRRLNSAALSLVEPGGLLLTCTCSSAMTNTPGAFLDMLKEAATMARRQVTVLRVGAAGPDHPTNPHYPESQYLTSVLLFVA